jgi:DNA-binding NtrC family response regulator
MASDSSTMAPAAPRPVEQAARVLYLQPAAHGRVAVEARLAKMGLGLAVAQDVSEAVRLLKESPFALCLVDLGDERPAIASIRVIRAQHTGAGLVGVVDPVNALAASEALLAGAVDLLPWPFDERDVHTMLANARDRGAVEPDRRELDAVPPRGLVAQSPTMRRVLDQVRTAAGSQASVMLCGEPSTGRELVARAIHSLGDPGADRPFVIVACDGRTPGDLDVALFDCDTERKAGRGGPDRLGPDGAVARAIGGTLFLVNLADAPARTQARLARLLRDGEAAIDDRRGTVELALRPIAAMSADVDAFVADGRLRKDLFERLAQHRIEVPPLRRRREDIPLLAIHFLQELCERQQIPVKGFSRAALSLLSALPWRGNAEELMGLLETLVWSVRRSVIQIDDLLAHASLDGISARIDPGTSLRDAKARFERECISAVLQRHHGKVGEAAKALGIQRTNLYRKVRQLKVPRALLTARR